MTSSESPADDMRQQLAEEFYRSRPLPMTVDAMDEGMSAFYARIAADFFAPVLEAKEAEAVQLRFDRDAAQAAADLLVQQLEDLRDDVLGDESLLVPEIVSAAGRTVERLTAEAAEIRAVLVAADPKSDLPGHAFVPTVDIARAVAAQRDEQGRMAVELFNLAKERQSEIARLTAEVEQMRQHAETQAAIIDGWVRYGQRTNERMREWRAEVSRLREQLAAQPKVPQVDDDRIDRVAQALHEQRALEFAWNVKPWKDLRVEDQRRFRRQAMAAVEAVFAGVSSSEVEAPPPQERAQPTGLTNESVISSQVDGRPSGSERLAPRPMPEAPYFNPSTSLSASNESYGPHTGALLDIEIEDAAQAARSEATLKGFGPCVVCGQPGEEHATRQWCMSDQYVDGSWPSPSLRKEGEDRPAGVDVLADVAAERRRQEFKWGQQNHADRMPAAYPIGDRPNADLAAAHWKNTNSERVAWMNEHGMPKDRNAAWDGILLEEVYEALAETDSPLLRAELIQVAAVAVAWVEAIDRRVAAAVSSQEKKEGETE